MAGDTGIQLSVIDSAFRDNRLVFQPNNPNTGIINAEYGGTFFISGTNFIKNKFAKEFLKKGIASVVYFGGFPLPKHKTILNIQNSSFIRNKYLTNALVLGGYLHNNDYTLLNNYEIGNIFTGSDSNSYCPGISRIRKAGDTIYEQCIVRFDTSSSLSISSYPSITPLIANPTISSKPSNCWSTDFTEKVMNAEMDIFDVSIPRIYRMCNNEIAEINTFNYDDDTFDNEPGKFDALSIWNSNVHIICGIHKNNNNCTITGGTFQIQIIPKAESEPVTNIMIQGFKFTDVSEVNIVVYGANVEKSGLSPPGASILIKDCHFFVSKVP